MLRAGSQIPDNPALSESALLIFGRLLGLARSSGSVGLPARVMRLPECHRSLPYNVGGRAWPEVAVRTDASGYDLRKKAQVAERQTQRT